MRLGFAALFLFAASHGGSNCDCGHMGSGAHSGAHTGNLGNARNSGQAGFSGAHMNGMPWTGRAAGAPAFHAVSAPVPHHGFLHELATGIRHALGASADILAAALSMGPDAEAPPDVAGSPERACASVDDCGDGELGHGMVCDRWSTAPRNAGVCREACRDDGDCPAPLRCRPGLDPDGPQWAGCIP